MRTLLFDPEANALDLRRLPATAAPPLRDFYERRLEEGDDADAAAASREWFELCQRLPGCAYLSAAPDGEPYELEPTIANLSRAAHQLLVNDTAVRRGATSSSCDRSGTRDPARRRRSAWN